MTSFITGIEYIEYILLELKAQQLQIQTTQDQLIDAQGKPLDSPDKKNLLAVQYIKSNELLQSRIPDVVSCLSSLRSVYSLSLAIINRSTDFYKSAIGVTSIPQRMKVHVRHVIEDAIESIRYLAFRQSNIVIEWHNFHLIEASEDAVEKETTNQIETIEEKDEEVPLPKHSASSKTAEIQSPPSSYHIRSNEPLFPKKIPQKYELELEEERPSIHQSKRLPRQIECHLPASSISEETKANETKHANAQEKMQEETISLDSTAYYCYMVTRKFIMCLSQCGKILQ